MNKVAEYFNLQAANYLNHFNDDNVEAILNNLDIKSNSIVLEAGSGTSEFTPYILSYLGQTGRVYCLDIAENMVQIAKKILHDSRVNFICGDIETYKYESKQVDMIICFNMYPHISDKPRFIAHAAKSLSSGGIVTICHDRTREDILAVHHKYQVDTEISKFPETQETLTELTTHGFKILKVVTKPYYLIKAELE